MDTEVIHQLRAWNPWWEMGIEGLKKYDIPDFEREAYKEIQTQFENGRQIVSIVGMRQIGKSTIMRQTIRSLLRKGVPAESIFYISFDDPFLEAESQNSNSDLMENVVASYSQFILRESLDHATRPLYFFFDEIHKLPRWDEKLKVFFDRAYPVKYMISGSSSLRLQKQNRESLLGRVTEFTLWPFSFREFLEFRTSSNERLKGLLSSAKSLYQDFLKTLSVAPILESLKEIYREADVWEKETVTNLLKEYLLVGGFPRVWEEKLDFASRQRVLWEQHIVKVLYEDLVQATGIRKPKELAHLFIRIVQWNGNEFRLRDLQEDLRISNLTLEKYLEYFIKTFLVFRVDKTKTKRYEVKRKTGYVKFYVTDVAFRNALYKRDENIFEDPEEMGLIAENLVCSQVLRWITGPYREDAIQFYKDNSGEVDFIIKQPEKTIPIEVKWREQIQKPKTMDRLAKKWGLEERFLITKNDSLDYGRDGQLSIPLWFFLMVF